MTTAATHPVTEDLRRWIIAQAEAGCRPEDIIAAMVKSGWEEDVALDARHEELQVDAIEHGTGHA